MRPVVGSVPRSRRVPLLPSASPPHRSGLMRNGGHSSLCRLDRGPGRFFCGKAIPSFPWHDGQWARGPSRRNRQPGAVAIITQDTPPEPAGLTPAGSGVSGVEALVRWVLLVIGSLSGVGNQGRAEDPRHPQRPDGVVIRCHFRHLVLGPP